jgi:hypothetical protein
VPLRVRLDGSRCDSGGLCRVLQVRSLAAWLWQADSRADVTRSEFGTENKELEKFAKCPPQPDPVGTNVHTMLLFAL